MFSGNVPESHFDNDMMSSPPASPLRLFDDKTAFSMSPPTNGLPLENHLENSIASMSFDSEAGYGNKVADFQEEVSRFESLHLPPVESVSYVKNSLPILPSPPKSGSDSKIPNPRTILATPISKADFLFSDVHSPVSSSKFIERSLHDLDDLINQRRLELSELKRSNRQKIIETPDHLDHTPHQFNHSQEKRRGSLEGQEKRRGSLEGPEKHGYNPSPTITMPRLSYDEIREGERNIAQQLKAEQAKADRLENKLEDVKSQCNAHAERAKAVTAERNRLENQRVQAEEELLALNEEILFLRNQLQSKSSHIQELESENITLKFKEERLLSEIKASVTPGLGNAVINSYKEELDAMKGHEADINVVESSTNVHDECLTRFAALEVEASLLRERCMETELANEEWASKVEELEDERKKLEEEKMAANTVAFQWQSEAVHFEREFLSREEIVLQAQHATGQLERRLIELQASIDEKDLSLIELIKMNSAGLLKPNGKNEDSQTKIPESLHTKVISTDSSTLTDPIVENLMSPPPSMSRNPIPAPVTEAQMTSSFW
eukprot:CAMPEP_0119043582 /NCGR_PEP_ID=MMETSP1177-20130426/23536_1 /TAXON_ID=2985 /ORGANISM="Ochromonas sp, Strain CCMP1899" /LENGTH=551 /DNA_ID=CAMNT_0007011971 /DNA_START=65 /DNA_END=1717 /DNA_ORIENTATION=-